MSPEQAGGDSSAVETGSDFHALGVVTFELLSGALPHDLSAKIVHQAVRMIREEDPRPLASERRAVAILRALGAESRAVAILRPLGAVRCAHGA